MATRKMEQAAGQAGQAPAPGNAPAAQEQGAGGALPELTVKVFPIRNSRSKLRATANVNIARAFAVQGFRIFDSKNGLFVKEPEQNYIKEGTEMSRPVFFPVTAEARKTLHGQILHSYELTMEKEMGQRVDDLDDLLDDEYAPPAPEVVSPEDDLPFDVGMSM